MFVMNGCPALAITSEGFMPGLSAGVTHSPRDVAELVDCRKLAAAAEAIACVVKAVA
jgi:hypothetical protein